VAEVDIGRSPSTKDLRTFGGPFRPIETKYFGELNIPEGFL
jgi:hypothetical protein